MKTPHPSCPICQGRGWYETGLYETDWDPQPCPTCSPTEPITSEGWVAICLFLGALLGIALWVLP